MAKEVLGGNITFPIYNADGTPFNDLVLHKATYESVVMSLGDKITGDVYYKDNTLDVTLHEYIVFRNNPNDPSDGDVRYVLLSPPVVVKEGMVSDNSDLKGMTKYSFTFYHPMCKLSNMPFSDVAVSFDEKQYKSEDKKFSWIGKLGDFVNKIDKNLQQTEWKIELSNKTPQSVVNTLSDVLSFDGVTIADALKTMYDTWEVPFIIDSIKPDEAYYSAGKRFLILVGLPSNEIYASENDRELLHPFVFKYGKGVGLKNNSANPRNNKIITRIAGKGSEDNIPYGYPQIVWTGDPEWEYTINNASGMQSISVNNQTVQTMSYPIYDGIVNGEYVKLIKHPFTRTYLMPSVYSESVNRKVNPNAQGYNPETELIDYYDADDPTVYPNTIDPTAPSYELHEFEDIKPELGNQTILGAYPINNDLEQVEAWVDTMDGDGNYAQSYFKVQLPVLSFDLYACAAITQEMQLNMRSGACIGCTFPVQVDWDDYKANFYDSEGNFLPDGEQRDLEKYPKSDEEQIEIILQKEYQTFGTIMPNIYQKPMSGDKFVVLGISLPLSYISGAEQRLDDEMKSYMLANNVHYFDYPLKFDEKFLYEHKNILSQIRNNTIVRFEYAGVELELHVKQITIKFGEGVLPQYDITLTDDVEVVLNQIGQAQKDISRLNMLISALRQKYGNDVWVELANKLSRVANDTAQGRITFLKGLTAESSSQFKGIANETTMTQKGGVTFGIGTPTHDNNPVIRSKNQDTGFRGWYIDNFGNAELESLKVRSYLEVLELLVNRLQAQEGDTIFSDNDQIESVEQEIANNGDVSYVLTLKEKWEGYFTSQREGNILKGVVNTLAAKQRGSISQSDTTYDNSFVAVASPEGSPVRAGYYEKTGSGTQADPYLYKMSFDNEVVSGKTYYQSTQGIDNGGNIYYTSWMLVDDVFDVVDAETQTSTRKIRVSLYPDNEVPSQKNFPPCAEMVIARWGCEDYTLTEQEIEDLYANEEITAEEYAEHRRNYASVEKRQRLFYISSTDGRIMKLSHVDRPILNEWNYGTTLGTIPDFMWDWNEVAEKALPSRDYLYAQGIIYQSLIHVNPQGEPICVFVDKGLWQNNTRYLHNEYNSETGEWETHDVWWMGCKWRCARSQPETNSGVTSYKQPMFNSQSWTFLEGDDKITMSIVSSNGNQFKRGAESTTLTPYLYYGANIDITSNPLSSAWYWTRETTSSGNDYTNADTAWNNLHTATRILALTYDDFPENWQSVKFTCHVPITKAGATSTITASIVVNALVDGVQGQPVNTYQLMYYGWSKDVSTNDSTTEPTVESQTPNATVNWQLYIPQEPTGNPYLWIKTVVYQWQHAYDANDNPIYSATSTTYARVTGESGTGFQPKGSVADNTALNALTGMSIGDAYIMTSTGHLWVYTTDGWKDFGEIKGSDGLNAYIHIAWAHAVGSNGYPEGTAQGSTQEGSAMGFTVSKLPSENFEYMGVKTDNVLADSLVPSEYTWNRLNSYVKLDLDNDNDTMLYSDGVRISGTITSQATLYVGGNSITNGVTYSLEFSKVNNINSAQGSVNSSGLVTITDVLKPTAWVLVKATYNGNVYATKLTLRRSEDDKYEIIPLSNAILFNITTQSPEEGAVDFKIKRTNVSGYSEYIDDRQQGLEIYVEATDYDEYVGQDTVYYYGDDIWSADVYDNSGYDAYRIRVEKEGTGEVLDEEYIPIIKTNDGEDAISLIITPPAIVVSCNSNGKTSSSCSFDVHADLKRGSTSATGLSISNISTPSGITHPSAPISGGVLTLNIAQNVSSNNIDGVVTFTVTGRANGTQIQAIGRVNISTTLDGKQGDAGQNSVRLDLDNELDSIQYGSDGTKFTTNGVMTHARLYDGNVAKGSDVVTWYDIGTGTNNSTVDGCTASKGTYDSATKSQSYIVSDVSSDTGTLTVKARYGGAYHTAVFSVKKLINKDKYELMVTPDAIAFNPDEQSTPASGISVRISHWNANGVYEQISSVSTSTSSNVSGLRLYAATINASGVETLGSPVALTNSAYTISKANINTALSAYRFILKDGVGGNVLDYETVPIAKVYNGQDGITVDLSNEMDAVPLDDTGYTTGATNLSTIVKLYNGTQEQTLANLTAEWDVTYYVVTTGTSAIVPTCNATTGSVSLTMPAQRQFRNSDKAILHIKAYYDSTHYKQLDFTIQGIRAGVDGDDAVIYQLNPSETVIKKSKLNVITPSVITCNIIRREGNKTPTTITGDGGGGTSVPCIVYFKRDMDAEWVQYSSTYVTNGIPTSTGITTGIQFRLYQGNSAQGAIWDTETVPLVEDGKDGSGANSIRLDLDNEMDSMQYSGTTKVTEKVFTHARLYDGTTLKSLSDITSWDNLIATGCTASWDSDETGTNYKGIKVTAISQSDAQVVVGCTYKGTKYYATFVVKKIVDQPKYELVVSPDAISYNNTQDTFSNDTVISINIRKTDIDGTISNLTTLQNQGLWLDLKKWSGEEYVSCTTTPSGNGLPKSYTASNDIEEDTFEYLVELRKTSSTGIVLDSENIPITVVRDGSSVSLDVQYSPNKTTIHTTFSEGDIYMRTKKSTASSWSEWVRIVGEGANETDYKFNIAKVATTTNAQTAPAAANLAYSEWQDAPMAITATYPFLWAKVTKKDKNGNITGTYYIRLTGENGETAVTYEIRSTANEIVIGENDTSVAFAGYVSLWERVGANAATNESAWFVWYQWNGTRYTRISSNASSSATTSQYISFSSLTTATNDIVVFAKKGSSGYTTTTAPTSTTTPPTDYLARIDIPIRKQGGQGEHGENAIGINITNQADLISCYADGKVRYSRTITTDVQIYDGSSPAASGVTAPQYLSDLAIAGVQPTVVPITGGIRLTWEFDTSNTISQIYEKSIILNYGTNSYTTVFTLAPTNSTAVYQLAPEPSIVSFSKASNGTSLTPASIDLYYYMRMIDADKTTLITSLDNTRDYAIFKGFDNATSYGSSGDTVLTGDRVGSHKNITSSTSYKNFVMELWKMNNGARDYILDRQVIPIVKDGLNGTGTPATSYRIVIVSSSAEITSSGKLVAKIYWKVVQNTGGTDSSVSLSPSNSFYKIDDGNWTAINLFDNAYLTAKIDINTFASTPFPSSFTLMYGTSLTPVATAVVPISIVGQMGRNYYYAGIWSANETYTLTSFSAPFVLYRAQDVADAYYVMVGEDDLSISGNSYKPSDSSPYWRIMESDFKYLITEAMFTDFAKLGSAIFNKDYMFSQEGYMVGYNNTKIKVNDNTQYQHLDSADMDAADETRIQVLEGRYIDENRTQPAYANLSQFLDDDTPSYTPFGIRFYGGRYYTIEVDASSQTSDVSASGGGSIKNRNIVKIQAIDNRNSSHIICNEEVVFVGVENKRLCATFKCDYEAYFNLKITASRLTNNDLIDIKLTYITVGYARFAPSLYIDLMSGRMVANNLVARGMLHASSVGYSYMWTNTNSDILYVNDESYIVLRGNAGSSVVLLPNPTEFSGRVIDVYKHFTSGNWCIGVQKWASGMVIKYASGSSSRVPARVVNGVLNTPADCLTSSTHTKFISDGENWIILEE